MIREEAVRVSKKNGAEDQEDGAGNREDGGVVRARTETGMAIATNQHMAKIENFRQLIVWQKSMDLAERVYTLTEHCPPRERFGLAHQMRKSCVSIPSNIAEGTRHPTAAYAHYLTIALRSHAELDTQCELATRLALIKSADSGELSASIAEVGRLLHGLLRSLG